MEIYAQRYTLTPTYKHIHARTNHTFIPKRHTKLLKQQNPFFTCCHPLTPCISCLSSHRQLRLQPPPLRSERLPPHQGNQDQRHRQVHLQNLQCGRDEGRPCPATINGRRGNIHRHRLLGVPEVLQGPPIALLLPSKISRS